MGRPSGAMHECPGFPAGVCGICTACTDVLAELGSMPGERGLLQYDSYDTAVLC